MFNSKYSSATSFIDLLFTCILGVAVLLIMAITLISDKSKIGEIPAHAEFMITLEWDKDSKNDIDLWVRLPNGKKIYFKQLSNSGVFLDRDDLGIQTDTYVFEDGSVKVISINREVVSIRGFFPGKYNVNVHAYNLRKDNARKTESVKVTLIKINPYIVITEKTLVLDSHGQELTAFNFDMDAEGRISNITSYFSPMVYVE